MKQLMTWHTIILSLVVAMCLVLGGLGLYNSLRSHTSTADSSCTASAHNSVITVFYRPDTTANELQRIEASTEATHYDVYPQKHAFSVVTSNSDRAHVVAELHKKSAVTDIQVSAAQGCIDPN